MTDAVTILAMHPEMHTLFPNPPKRWRWIEAGDDIDATINDRGGDVEILLSASIEQLDKSTLSRFPKLRMIASISAGFSNVDLEECRARGIAVTNAPGLNSGDVADLAATMLTSLLLGIPKSQRVGRLSRSYSTLDGRVLPSRKHSILVCATCACAKSVS